ncbi:uncharacterized protein [Amphiura filiformis]|uniref:uncharacterized protein n=1 Tax=Amphiura filiformis TaxID=82378 RepID=UPI003B20CA63
MAEDSIPAHEPHYDEITDGDQQIPLRNLIPAREPQYDDVTAENQQIHLIDCIEKYQDKFPIFGNVYGNKHAFTHFNFSNGNKLRFLGTRDRIQVDTIETEVYEAPHELRPHALLPDDYAGFFELSSQYPDGHMFNTVAELAKDLPEYFLVIEELVIPELNVTICPGDRLKLICKGTNGEQHWLECKHVRTDAILSLPFDMNLKLLKKGNKSTYQAHELVERFPVRVRKEPDMGAHIRGINLHIPGISDDYDGELILNRAKVVVVELQDGSRKKIEIPSTMNISVVPLDPHKRQPQNYGPTTSIHDIAKNVVPGKPVFASLTGCPAATGTSLEDCGLAPGAVVVVHSATSKEAILVKGQKNRFLIPTEFRGEFEILADRFHTPYDLIQSGFKGKVRATNTCEVPDNLQEYHLDPLYEFDILEAVSNNTDDLRRIAVNRSKDMIDIVELKRTISLKGHLGFISVPGHMEASLLMSSPSDRHQTLFEILQDNGTGQKASFRQLPNNRNPLTKEDLLVEDSPFQIVGLCRYSATNITEYNSKTIEAGITREIPEFVEAQARQLLTQPSVKGGIDLMAPQTSITKLSTDSFDKLATIVQANSDPNHGYENWEKAKKRPVKPKIAPKPKPKPKSKKGGLTATTSFEQDPSGIKQRSISVDQGAMSVPPPPPSRTTSTRVGQGRGMKNRVRSTSVDEGAMLKSELNLFPKKPLNRTTSFQVNMQSGRQRFQQLTRSLSFKRRERPDITEGKTTPTKAKDVPIVEPPSDGNVLNFTVDALAGLMRYLKFSDQTVDHCLTKKIDGATLCQMSSHADEILTKELQLTDNTPTQLITIRYYIEKSVDR